MAESDWLTECFISCSLLTDQNIKKVKVTRLFSIRENRNKGTYRTKKTIFSKRFTSLSMFDEVGVCIEETGV